MRLQVKGRNVEVSDSIRRYAEEKLSKLERQLADPTQVELELAMETNPSIAANHVAEATIWTKGPTLRAREASSAFEASIDQIVDKLERQVKRYREKRSRRESGRRANGSLQPEPTPSAEQLDRMIVKSKQFLLRPMSPEEAVLQLELIGHDFFVFQHEETGATNVVYRRRHGGYGHIETEPPEHDT
ncbi:MAG TPA: ribosome-associated translation inhibitor RaiA [Gaiellaceae bacterium]|jgi:putative sigma-54 modulation protein|nr:ribosome-associated translation inhibitor RaiA [Gaiellaceae bacterium]